MADISKFKVGSRVTRTGESSPSQGMNRGSDYVIRSIGELCLTVDDVLGTWNSRNFELTKQAVRIKFNPYEKVCWYKADGLNINKGDEVYVGSGLKQWVKLMEVSTAREDLDRATVQVDDFRKASESESVKEHNFSLGDEVEIVNANGKESYNIGDRLTISHIHMRNDQSDSWVGESRAWFNETESFAYLKDIKKVNSKMDSLNVNIDTTEFKKLADEIGEFATNQQDVNAQSLSAIESHDKELGILQDKVERLSSSLKSATDTISELSGKLSQLDSSYESMFNKLLLDKLRSSPNLSVKKKPLESEKEDAISALTQLGVLTEDGAEDLGTNVNATGYAGLDPSSIQKTIDSIANLAKTKKEDPQRDLSKWLANGGMTLSDARKILGYEHIAGGEDKCTKVSDCGNGNLKCSTKPRPVPNSMAGVEKRKQNKIIQVIKNTWSAIMA